MTELLCIKTHSQGVVKAGEVWPELGRKRNPCCGYLTYDVGLKSQKIQSKCGGCGTIYINPYDIRWIGSKLLIPIGTQDELEQYEKETVLIEKI